MHRSFSAFPLLLALAGVAHAQSQGDVVACPQLPADSGLAWQHKAAGNADLCRALRADGSEAFGLYIAGEPSFKPGRANRAEKATIDGREVQWYRSEIANRPQVQARETLVGMPDGRVAHVWVQAGSQTQLDETMNQMQQLRFRGAQLTSN